MTALISNRRTTSELIASVCACPTHDGQVQHLLGCDVAMERRTPSTGRHPYACHHPCSLCLARDLTAVRDAIASRIEAQAAKQERDGHMRAADELRKAAATARLNQNTEASDAA